MRNLEKGQHIFIAFQNGKAVLDSQLRPRIYTSLENADKWTPTVNKGKIEYVEYAPTLTPPNEWVSVEERLPEDDPNIKKHIEGEQFGLLTVLVYNGVVKQTNRFFCNAPKFGLPKTDGWAWASGNVTHWMPLPAPPDRRPPEGEA